MAALRRQYRLVAQRAFVHAIDQNNANIMRALRARAPVDSLLDLGCDDGARTMLWADAAQARAVHGVEVVASRAALAERPRCIKRDDPQPPNTEPTSDSR